MESFTIIWFKLPLLCSIFIASPWVLYQVWAFISPGLYKRERRWATPFILTSAGLFIGGGCFAYFVVFRYGLTFLLGIGVDGHIGFNEPSSSLASRTRMKSLTERTRRDNAKAFGGMAQSPHHVITMGIGPIREARHCLLLAFGKKKARAIAGMVEGPVTAMNPASALQLHPRVTVCLDEPAASRLKMKSYYRWVFENKPA